MPCSTGKLRSSKSICAALVFTYLVPLTLAAQISPQEVLALAGYMIMPSTQTQPPGSTERDYIVARAKQLAGERIRDLPNFFCDMTVQRSRLQIKSRREKWKPITKEILVRLRFIDRREDYKTLRVGRQRSGESFSKIGKASLRSHGEFGGLLGAVPHMEFKWLGRARFDNKSVYVFDVTLGRNLGALSIKRDNFPGGKVGGRGIICIEECTNHTLGIVLEAADIPLSYGIESSSQSVIFSETLIGESIFLLPVASESIFRNSGEYALRQSARYRDYKKFSVESSLQFERVESKVSYTRENRR